jgi:hypothetical protein
MLRRSRAQAIVICACAVGVLIFILSQILGGGDNIPSGTPPVVIVTVLDHAKYEKEYIDNIKENRIQYAAKHGKSPWVEDLGEEMADNIQAIRHFSQTSKTTTWLEPLIHGREFPQFDTH